MSRLDELPPDQRAALSLLVRQHKTYAQVAGLLGIPEQAVHDRAHAALAVLAPREARTLDAASRLEVGDYLLGQQPGVAERLRTRSFLAGSQAAHAWANALVAELAALGGGPPPEIPAPSAAAFATGAPAMGAGAYAASAPAPQAPGEPQRLDELRAQATGAGGAAPGPPPQPRSSRLGGAILLAAIVAAVVVVIVLVSGGGSSKHASHTSTAKTSAATTTSASTTPAITNEITLRPPNARSSSTGKVDVLVDGSKRAFIIEAQHIPRTKGFYYAIWLYNSPTSALGLSRAPSVGSTHSFAGGAGLPSNAGDFHQILVTKETSSHPQHPGHVVLRAAFSLTR